MRKLPNERTIGGVELSELCQREFDSHAKKPRLQPLHDRVLIKLDLPKQEGLIIVPDIAREDPRTGEVLAVGPGRWRDDGFYRTALRPGQRVLISPAVNMNYDDIVKQKGEVMVQEDDVMGVLVDG